MLSTIERRQEIVKLILSQGKVMVDKLATKFAISTVTIRNDLNHLDGNNMLVRCRGGAIASTKLTRELSVKERYKKNLLIKQRLGQKAANLVTQGESIIIDSGTTTEEIALCLTDYENLTVMTNGLNIASVLADAKGVEVVMTGGVLRQESMSFYGKIAEKSLANMHFDKFLLGTGGVDLNTGVTTFFEPEASLNRLMCEISNEVIVVMDSSKIGQRGMHVIRTFAEITTLVTDSGLPKEYVEALASTGVKLCIVKR